MRVDIPYGAGLPYGQPVEFQPILADPAGFGLPAGALAAHYADFAEVSTIVPYCCDYKT